MQNKYSWHLFDFLKIFVVSRNTEILIESNFWLRMYEPCIFNSLSLYILTWNNLYPQKSDTKFQQYIDST